jgi:hypothetical protein
MTLLVSAAAAAISAFALRPLAPGGVPVPSLVNGATPPFRESAPKRWPLSLHAARRVSELRVIAKDRASGNAGLPRLVAGSRADPADGGEA